MLHENTHTVEHSIIYTIPLAQICSSMKRREGVQINFLHCSNYVSQINRRFEL